MGLAERIEQTSLSTVGRHGLMEALKTLDLETLIELKIALKMECDIPVYGNLWAWAMESIERPLILALYRKLDGNQVHITNALGVNRNTARKKLKALGLIGGS